ncbi:CRAL-TRIO domain-containing protein [Aspergillus lucknowensis]|uniref:CRAL-TRIO domain-containing protein n=1 Tax=Aspergillus lucknowensis TaxID=176173 RepID=A0ABR4LLY4_9EURO
MHALPFLHRRLCSPSANSIQSASSLLGQPSRRAQILTPSSRLPFSSFFAPSSPPKRTFSTPPLSSFQEPRKASTFWAITFTILFVCGGVWIKDKYRPLGSNFPQITTASAGPNLQEQDVFLLKNMSTEATPGTVGNLTPEQEVKLQEFWVLMFKVCGVSLGEIEETEERPATPLQEKKPAPKRRFGFWGGGAPEKDESTTVNGAANGVASLTITDGDDKFGTSKEFQKALVEMKPEEIRTSFWNMVKQDNPDSLLLRFLRARKWDVKKALMMLIATIRWRLLEAKVDDDIMVHGEHLALEQIENGTPAEKKKAEDMMKQFHMGKSFLHGVDKSGRPICYVRVRLHRASDQSTEALDRFTIFTIESARLMLQPPVETACIIFDMTDFTLANMDYHPVKFMIKCFEANYPESLGVVLIHKAPWIFSSSCAPLYLSLTMLIYALGIWNIIKGWLDPVVAAKIQFTKNLQDLEEFIPRDRIIKELEGDEDWEYKYVEVKPGENTSIKDTSKRDTLVAQRQTLAKELQTSTIDWIAASRKKESDQVKGAADKRKDLIERLRVQYWEMDPYVRCTTLYDRLGVVQGGGRVNFYPLAVESTDENEKPKENGAASTNGVFEVKA